MTQEKIKDLLLSTNEFDDNLYLDEYCNLLVKCGTKKEKYKTQAHHIIPQCYYRKNKIDINNNPENIVNLLHKDHVKAHVYLALCSHSNYMLSANKRAVTYALNKPYVDCHLELKDLLNCFEIFETYQSVMEVSLHFSEEHRSNLSAALIGKGKGVAKSEEFKLKLKNYYALHPKTPYLFTEETRRKIGESVSKYWSDLDLESKRVRNNKISSKLKGRPKPEGFAQHLSETRKNENNPFYGKHHTEEVKQAMSERMLKNNPFKGKSHTRDELDRAVQTRRLNGSYGPRIWINNGKHNKFIYPDDLSKYEVIGYMKGKLPHKKK